MAVPIHHSDSQPAPVASIAACRVVACGPPVRRDTLPMSAPQILTELEPDVLAETLPGLGAKPLHARQIYCWIYRRGVADFAPMTDLSRDLRAKLERTFAIPTPAVTTRSESADHTGKFLLRLGDEREVESVFIPDTPAMTFCVSTPAGCAMRYGFCSLHATTDELRARLVPVSRKYGLADLTAACPPAPAGAARPGHLRVRRAARRQERRRQTDAA